MTEMMTRKMLAEKYQFCEGQISLIKREMKESGLFGDECFWEGARYLRIDEDAFAYYMANRQKIKGGLWVAPFRRKNR